MRLETSGFSLCWAMALAFISQGANAVQAMPATMEDMWKIIQQQQKEIEALKAKASQGEQL